MYAYIHVYEDGTPQPRSLASLVQRRRAHEATWYVFRCALCKRHFEVRLGETGEHHCRPA